MNNYGMALTLEYFDCLNHSFDRFTNMIGVLEAIVVGDYAIEIKSEGMVFDCRSGRIRTCNQSRIRRPLYR